MVKPKKRPALIVEDDPIIALAIEEVLTAEGFAPVAVCATAKSAVEQLVALAPAVLILDAGLADRPDGWSIAELARETLLHRPKLIFVTGSPEAIPDSISRMGTVLAKPYREETLREAVRLAR